MRRRVGSPIDKRIRKDHILGKIEEKRDVHFIYNEVKETYGANGTVSFPPPVILRMRLLFILYNVRSEREHRATIPKCLHWLWFLGYGLHPYRLFPRCRFLRGPSTRSKNYPLKRAIQIEQAHDTEPRIYIEFIDRIWWDCILHNVRGKFADNGVSQIPFHHLNIIVFFGCCISFLF